LFNNLFGAFPLSLQTFGEDGKVPGMTEKYHCSKDVYLNLILLPCGIIQREIDLSEIK